PYIDGIPAGAARRADVVWAERLLHVDALPLAKLARRVPEEIGKLFGRPEIRAALDYSFDRAPEAVQAYMEANFNLGATEPLQPSDTAGDRQPSAEEGPRERDPMGDEASNEPGDQTSDAQDEDKAPSVPPQLPSEPHRPRQPAKPPKPTIMERL